MGDSMARGHVLVMSLWHDDLVQMKWLDAELGEDPGRTRGSCSGDQIDFDSAEARNAYVTFSNIRYGEIGTTVPDCASTTTSTTTSAPSDDIFVDLDFETQPADFTFGQSVRLDSDSLRFETSTANFGNGFLKSSFSVPGSHWGRIWMKLDSQSLTANLGHWVAVAGGTPSGDQIRMMDVNSNEAGKVVFQLGWQDDAYQKVTSWSDKYSLSTGWTCYEWHMDPNAQTFDFYVEGNAVTWDQPNGIGSGVPAGRSLPQSLDWVGFGVESFGGAATTIGGRLDNIVVSAERVGCGSAPESTDTPSTSTVASTTTPTSTTTTTTTPTSTTTTTTTPTTNCGYIPLTCGKPLTRIFNQRETKTLGKFEEITGVTLPEATLEDIQLYFHCKKKNLNKCAGLEKPCSCSSPPCICPGEEPPTTSTSASTTLTTASTTFTSAVTTSTASTTPSTTSTIVTTTQGRSQNCVLKACGCNLSGQSWCNDSNGWLSTDWCHLNAGNCQNCQGDWCPSGTNRRLLKQH